MSDEHIPVTTTGFGAAWVYFRLAIHALIGADLLEIGRWFPRHRRMNPMHRYLISNVVLYGVLALAFLGHWPPVQVGRTGLSWVDDPIPHAIWGLTVLGVSASQIAVLITPRWLVWQICAVGTAMWAGAFGMATLVVGVQVHSYGGIAIWFWVVHVHMLLVGNRLVPASAGMYQGELTDEHALVARLERLLHDEGNGMRHLAVSPHG